MMPTELELIASRDHEAMARFYDHHVAVVGEYCGALCPDSRLDEAVAAVFVNFLARAIEAPPDAEPERLLRKAAREVAASRMEVEGASGDERRGAVCRAMPELLAARVNGELGGQEGPVVDHLSDCPTCRGTAARLGQAEVMFPVGSGGEVTELRGAWLELAAATAGSPGAADAAEPARAEEAEPAPAAEAEETTPTAGRAEMAEAAPRAGALDAAGAAAARATEVPRVGAEPSFGRPSDRRSVRRGGLVGAIRRFAASARSGEPTNNPEAKERGI